MPETDSATRTAGEQEFINQKTRELMVNWCHLSVIGASTAHGFADLANPDLAIYLEFAKSKKWISMDGTRILSAGWDTAARFLKR